jgi:hypothetical protein
MDKDTTKSKVNILLTGIPRSGTTLACRLLSEVSDVVALNEPMWPDQFTNRQESIQAIHDTCNQLRTSLLNKGIGIARTVGGQITDNAYSETKDGRKRIVERGPIHFEKKLSPDFKLILKHCAEFTLLLPELNESFNCYAIIRNPLALLGSWASVDVPVSRGKVAKSAKLLPMFHQKIEGIDGLLDKQLYILDWYFSQYTNFSEEQIIRYEDIITTKGGALSLMAGKEVIDNNLMDRNKSSLYDPKFLSDASTALINSKGAYWRYYQKEDVIALLEEMTASL